MLDLNTLVLIGKLKPRKWLVPSSTVSWHSWHSWNWTLGPLTFDRELLLREGAGVIGCSGNGITCGDPLKVPVHIQKER